MHQNPEVNEQVTPEKNRNQLRLKRKIRQAFKLGNFDQKTMLSTFKQYYHWKEKRSVNIPFQELKSNEREPIFSIALHCGTKNGQNQVLQEYMNSKTVQVKKDTKNATMNNFQKMLNGQSSIKSIDDSKRLTFVDFKTKRNQRTNFFSYADVSNIRLATKHEKFCAKTEPKAKTTYLGRTSFPKELANMKQMIKKLPSVRQEDNPETTFLQQNREINPTLANNSYLSFSNPYNYTWTDFQQESNEDCRDQRKKLFKKFKTQSIRGYINELNEVISYADELIHEQSIQYQRESNRFLTIQNRSTHKSISPDSTINNRKYWPEYPKYSIRLKKKNEDQQHAKFFTNFSYSDPKLNDNLQSIVSAIKSDLNNQEEQMNKEIAQSQKQAIWHRYKYKMSIQRQNYKRNVKSFLKCKKEYRIQKRREEVRANGIVRMKKSNPMQKMIKKVQTQQQDA